jgi:hypothetical protein
MAERDITYNYFEENNLRANYKSACDYGHFDVSKIDIEDTLWETWQRQPDGRLGKNPRHRVPLVAEVFIAKFEKDLKRT